MAHEWHPAFAFESVAENTRLGAEEFSMQESTFQSSTNHNHHQPTLACTTEGKVRWLELSLRWQLATIDCPLNKPTQCSIKLVSLFEIQSNDSNKIIIIREKTIVACGLWLLVMMMMMMVYIYYWWHIYISLPLLCVQLYLFALAKDNCIFCNNNDHNNNFVI